MEGRLRSTRYSGNFGIPNGSAADACCKTLELCPKNHERNFWDEGEEEGGGGMRDAAPAPGKRAGYLVGIIYFPGIGIVLVPYAEIMGFWQGCLVWVGVNVGDSDVGPFFIF